MIYFDNAATTKPCEGAIEAQNYSNKFFFNPSALYLPALKIEGEINKVRQKILAKLNFCATHNLIFTSGATEANNLALFQASRFKGKTILIGGGEHPSIYQFLRGSETKFLEIALTKTGEVDLDDLKKKLTSDVAMVSIMQVSNETGAITDIEKVLKTVKSFSDKIWLHCDAVQGFCKIPQQLPKGVDLISISSHKINGLKGTGALIYENSLNLKPHIKGGGQEFDLRSGTLNVGGILAFGAAVDIKRDYRAMEKLNAYTREKLLEIPGAYLNGSGSPYIINVSLEGARSEVIVRMLEEYEIYISNGSACSSRSGDNRILSAMGVPKKLIEGTIRISFCEDNTKGQVDNFIKRLREVLEEIRK